MHAGGRLHQEPAPELVALRKTSQRHISSRACDISHSAGLRLPEVAGPSADLGFTLRRGQSSAAGLLLRAWLHADGEGAVPTAAAVVMDWESSTLEASTPFLALHPSVSLQSAVQSSVSCSFTAGHEQPCMHAYGGMSPHFFCVSRSPH